MTKRFDLDKFLETDGAGYESEAPEVKVGDKVKLMENWDYEYKVVAIDEKGLLVCVPTSDSYGIQCVLRRDEVIVSY